MTPMTLGRDSGELRKCVVHMKRFVVQNFLENRTRRRIVLHHVAINREAAGRSLLR